tara:strand:- start:99 stop:443 length:345 start_codon:yes stop_codon:yes gene_type:complete
MDLVIFNPSEDDKRLIMRDSTHMENIMKHVITLFILSLALSGCSTVGQIWETGVEVVSNTVDTVVGGASDLVTAVGTDIVETGAFVVDTTAGVVEGVSERVDAETDKLVEDEGK